uniref:TIL domain-containing protein n=1 Tax=Panagrolaimus sp. ES5 TaxID=591445 RepID=A0AC34FNK6_9BILA
MNIKFVLVFIGLLFVSVAVKAQSTTDSTSNVSSDSPQKCGENEEWNECGTMCPPKCARRQFMPRPIVCNKMCYPSCQCVEGFLRNFDGKCVEPKDCRRFPLPIRPVQPQLPTTERM